MGNIKTRRRLSDLFLEGTEVRFGKDSATGKRWGEVGPFLNSVGERAPCPADQIAVFVRPPDPLQRDMAMREANAKRARALVKAKRDENSEEYLTIMAFLSEMSDTTLVEYVLQSDEQMRVAEAEREILAWDEWKEMTAYQDAMRQFQEMSEEELEGNAEFEALIDLDVRFTKQITERERELADAQRDVLRMLVANSRAEVEKKALDRRSEMVGTQAFMNEYELQMLFFSIRDAEDGTALFFDNAKEVASQPDLFREKVNEALMPYIADGSEAKNLQGVESGSEQSDPPRKPATSESSTPVEQNA